MVSNKRTRNIVLTVVCLVAVGLILQWLSFLVYPNSLVNVPVKTSYEFGFLTFTRIVYYQGGAVLKSPPQLDYFQMFCLIAAIYLIVTFTFRSRGK